VKHSEYKFSKDLLDANAPHFAFFTVPDAVGMVTEDNQVIYDNEQKKTVLDQGPAKGKNLRNAQAYLQKLYDDIDQLK
ncbi:MAG: LTA synthase family protein, partial [Prevotella sp.]